MQIKPAALDGLMIIEPKVFKDDRGYFFEFYQRERYFNGGITCQFVQDNLSCSVQNTLRGLHFQHPKGQAKLVQVLKGEVFDVAVDIRVGSPSFGTWEGVWLSADNCRQLFIPEGFAHGFCVTSKDAIFSYKCSHVYDPETEGGIAWNDADIDIDWPIGHPILSNKDAEYPMLSAIDIERLPKWKP